MMEREPLKRLLFVFLLFTLAAFFILSGQRVQATPAAQSEDVGKPVDGPITDAMRRFLENQAAPPENVTSTAATPCVGGMADIYPCHNVDLLSHISLTDMAATAGNDSWGWTDPLDGKEYAMMGLDNGTAFVDISDPENPIYLGKLPTHTANSTWRDIKVYANHAFIVSEASGHGMQVFDLTELRTVVSPPVTFSNTAHYSQFGNAHNLAINEDSGYAYAVGTSTCSGGLHMVNIQNPTSPTNAGCFSADGYTHDVQCVMYAGPDPDHQGDEICFAYNEDTVTIVDVTNKAAPAQLSRTPYAGSEYTHQGWLTPDHRYILHDDELDEQSNGHNTRTYVWDAANLEAPILLGNYTAGVAAIDHNLYIKGNYAFEANYRSGLRILDITDVATPLNITEVAFFDTYPESNTASFDGAWSNYPYFESGVVVISDIDRGLFMVRPILASFSLTAVPTNLDICQGADALYTVTVTDNGSNDPVTLTAVDVPAGANHNFSVNPVIPTGTSDFTITNTAVIPPGNYSINIIGSNLTDTLTATVNLNVSTGAPGVPTLTTPADGATDVILSPTFEWMAASQGVTYDLDVATDSGFGDIVYSATGITDLEHTMTAALEPTTTYYWRVQADNACGSGGYSGVFSFETRAVPPILLVDDDDNSPNVRATYTTALDNLGLAYDVWDTNNSDDEPSAAQLAPYETVIWFTGDEFGGAAGPGDTGETALAGWLDAGGCLFISAQDYLWDRGQTDFMSNYLGMASGTSDITQTSVTGAGSVYSGLGPYALSYPFTNYSDRISPNGTAELAFSGNQGDAAINKDGGVYRTAYWGFPWEAIPTATDRETAMQTTLTWCGGLVSYGVNLTPSSQGQEALPGEVVTYTVNIENSGTVSDTFDITVAGNSWSSTPSDSSLWLEAGTSDTFTVVVTIPGDAVGGTMDVATVTAVSQGDPTEMDSATLTTTATAVYGVAASADPAALSDEPGAVVTYTVHLTNTGNTTDTFSLSTADDNGWTSHVEPVTVTLAAGASEMVMVMVHVPGDAVDEEMNVTTVTAVSVTDASATAEVELTTTVEEDAGMTYIYLPIILKP